MSQVEEWLILSVEVGGSNAVPGANEAGVVEIGGNGIITANPAAMFPVDMVVDYVRVYDRIS